MPKAPRILILFFLLIFLLQMFGLLVLLSSGEQASAQEIELNTTLPNMPGTSVNKEGKTVLTVNGNTIGNFVLTLYKLAVNVVGVLATVVMMFGGILWITAGGNAGKVDNAKSWIAAAATGLVLTLASYTLLNTISPDLVNFKSINPQKPEANPSGCCEPSGSIGNARTTTRSDCPDTFRFDSSQEAKNGICVYKVSPGCCRCVNSGVFITNCFDADDGIASEADCDNRCATFWSFWYDGRYYPNQKCHDNPNVYDCVPLY